MAYNDPSLLEVLLARLYRDLSRCDTARECAWSITREVIPFLELDDCVIYLADAEQSTLVQAAAFGTKVKAHQMLDHHLKLHFGQGIVGSAAQSQQVQLVPDTRNDPRYVVDGQSNLSELAVPVVYDKRVYAVMDSENSRVDFFKPEHVQVFTSIAQLVAPFFARFDPRLFSHSEKKTALQSN